MSELITCPMCESHDSETLGKVSSQPGYSRCRCRSCEGQFFIPRQSAQVEYYLDFPEAAVISRWEFDIARDAINAQRPPRHLDVGAGNGAFISMLSVETRIALEPSTVKPLHPGGEEMRVADFDQIDGQFESVSAFHVLEHVETPLEFLRAIRAVMAPGGRLYVSFPNPARWEAELYQDHYDLPPNHLNIISRASAYSMFQRTGFRVEKVVEEAVKHSVVRLGSNQFYALVREHGSEAAVVRLSCSRLFRFIKPLVFLPFVANCAIRRALSDNRKGYTILYVLRAV